MSQQKLNFININIQLLWAVLKNSCFESWSKSLKNKREEVQFLARLQVCRLHRYFFKNFSKVSSLRVKWQLFLGTPFFKNSSLQLLLDTRVNFDRSTVNFYFSMSIVKKKHKLQINMIKLNMIKWKLDSILNDPLLSISPCVNCC